MGLADRHDPRTFRHFTKVAADGSVAAIVEVAEGTPDPTDAAGSLYVEVTDLHPYDFGKARIIAAPVLSTWLAAVAVRQAAEQAEQNALKTLPKDPQQADAVLRQHATAVKAARDSEAQAKRPVKAALASGNTAAS